MISNAECTKMHRFEKFFHNLKSIKRLPSVNYDVFFLNMPEADLKKIINAKHKVIKPPAIRFDK